MAIASLCKKYLNWWASFGSTVRYSMVYPGMVWSSSSTSGSTRSSPITFSSSATLVWRVWVAIGTIFNDLVCVKLIEIKRQATIYQATLGRRSLIVSRTAKKLFCLFVLQQLCLVSEPAECLARESCDVDVHLSTHRSSRRHCSYNYNERMPCFPSWSWNWPHPCNDPQIGWRGPCAASLNTWGRG